MHWESCRLRAGWVAAGWAGGVAAAVAGVGAMVMGQGSLLEPAGAALAAAGATAVALVIRCRRWSTSVGREWIRTGTGPFLRLLPVRAVEETQVRPASGVRRLFAASEVVLKLGASGEEVLIASPEPAGLCRELEAQRAGAAGGGRGAEGLHRRSH